MRQIIIFFILIQTLNSWGQAMVAQQSKQKSDREKKGLKGDVESILEISSAKNSFNQEFKDEIKTTFNKKGNIIEEMRYLYTTSIPPQKKFGSKDMYEYNSLDNKLKKYSYYVSPDNLVTTTSYRYDLNQQLIEVKPSNGYITDYKYDEQGNNNEIIIYSQEMKIAQKISKKYDSFGNEIETIGFTFGNKIFNEPDRRTKSTSKFDIKGVLLETIQYDNTDIIRKVVYLYDANGNLIEEKSFSKTGKLEFKESYKYIYDSKKNWVNKISYGGSIEMSRSIREINYVNSKILQSPALPLPIPAYITDLRKLNNTALMSKIFKNPIIRQRLLKLLGKERLLFMEDRWSLGTPIKVENDIVFTTGCMSHFCMDTNFIVIIDIAQNTFHIGIRDNGKVKTYSENDINNSNISKEKMQHWIEYGSD